MRAKTNLYLTGQDNSGQVHLVAEGHSKAMFLVCRAGDEVPQNIALKYGLPEEAVDLTDEEREDASTDIDGTA